MGGGKQSGFQKVLDAITHTLPASPKGASHYECIVVGKGLGAPFTHRLAHRTHGHNTLCSVNTGGNATMHVNRFLYEQGRVKGTDFFINSKLGVNLSAATSDGYGVKQYLPDENAVILTNDRRIEYDHLVIASGMNYDWNTIKGFEAAWADFDTPVYTTHNHSSWNLSNVKYLRQHGNYFHGDAYFYIPPGNYRGEVASFNFLATAAQWDWAKTIGKLSPTAKYHVVVGNDYFVKHNKVANDLFIAECEKRGIEIIWGQKMTEVDGPNKTFVLENMVSGETQTRDFNNLYAIPTANPGAELAEAGLANQESGGFLDVDMHTLRHNKYPNVFGLGDVNNLPTSKTWYSGVMQLHVLGNNVFRNIKGLPLNAKYDGFSKSPLYLDHNKMTWMTHNYEGSISGDCGNASFPMSQIRYFFWQKALAGKNIPSIYKGKSNGPPRYKAGEPKWSELPADEANKPNTAGYKVIRKDGTESAHAH